MRYQISDKLFSNLNLTFNRKFMLSGPIGTGKSTLLKLIFGIYKNFKGQISLGKLKLNNNYSEWRQNIYYYSQHPRYLIDQLEIIYFTHQKI